MGRTKVSPATTITPPFVLLARVKRYIIYLW